MLRKTSHNMGGLSFSLICIKFFLFHTIMKKGEQQEWV